MRAFVVDVGVSFSFVAFAPAMQLSVDDEIATAICCMSWPLEMKICAPHLRQSAHSSRAVVVRLVASGFAVAVAAT